MLSPANDFFLQVGAEVAEVIAIASDSDYEAAVGLWVTLGIPKRLCVYYIELDVVAVQLEIGPHQVEQRINALFAFER